MDTSLWLQKLVPIYVGTNSDNKLEILIVSRCEMSFSYQRNPINHEKKPPLEIFKALVLKAVINACVNEPIMLSNKFTMYATS